jgi:ribonuclease VapC
MMVVDSSAVVAIFRQEPDAGDLARRIAEAARPMMSAASVLETSIFLRGLKQIAADEAERWLDAFLRTAEIDVEPFNAAQADLARAAHIRFGKGTGHAAQLNYGDCFTYALAKAFGAPVLFKGGDFARTDLDAVV